MSSKNKKKVVVLAPTAIDSQIGELQSKLAALKEQATAAHQEAEKAFNEKVAGLPGYLGLPDLATVRKALNKAMRPAGSKRGRRSKVTDEIRSKVIELVKADKMTGQEIATECKLSIATIQNIKKEAGLVNERA